RDASLCVNGTPRVSLSPPLPSSLFPLPSSLFPLPSSPFPVPEHLTQNLSAHIPTAQHDDALVIREARAAGHELPPARNRDAAGALDDHVVRQHHVTHRLR